MAAKRPWQMRVRACARGGGSCVGSRRLECNMHPAWTNASCGLVTCRKAKSSAVIRRPVHHGTCRSPGRAVPPVVGLVEPCHLLLAWSSRA
eukprot:355626-Chlamydomonas_euryale.AAC.4